MQILQTFSAGVDHTIPLVPPGVTLCSARGAHDVSVAEWIIAVLLSRYRQLHKFQEKQNAATWDRATFELATNEKPSIGSLKKIQVKYVPCTCTSLVMLICERYVQMPMSL